MLTKGYLLFVYYTATAVQRDGAEAESRWGRLVLKRQPSSEMGMAYGNADFSGLDLTDWGIQPYNYEEQFDYIEVWEENNMIKHIILWQLKDEFSQEEKVKIKTEIKEGLEALAGKIPGLIEICVNTEPLDTSNADVMLDSTFENQEALKGYAIHPEHVKVADSKVRPFTKTRTCMDFEVDFK